MLEQISRLRIALAGYGLAGIGILSKLLGFGIPPKQIFLMTHLHAQNEALLMTARQLSVCVHTHKAESTELSVLLKEFGPDVLISAHYREVFPDSVLSIPAIAAINMHPALLPRHRGAFSVVHALIEGDHETGVTWHYMTNEIDAGRVLLQTASKIESFDTAFSLYHRLIGIGIESLDEVMTLILQNYRGKPQVGKHSYHSRTLPNGGVIDPNWPDSKIERFIRAMIFPPHKKAILIAGDGEQIEVGSIEQFKSISKSRC